MTSEKYFSKWVREAGRGHLTALLAWGSLLLYGIITAAQLRFKSDYFFFGMGSGELLRICAGLGAVISFLEFFYLLQPKKLDFYYSLPVRKILEQVCTRADACFHSAVPGDYGLRTV